MKLRPTHIGILLAVVMAFAGSLSFGAGTVHAQLTGPGWTPIPGQDPYMPLFSPRLSPSPSTTSDPATIGVVPKNTVTGPTTSLTGYCAGFNSTPASGNAKLADLFKYFTCIIQRMIVPLLMAIGGLVFVVGMVKFITSGESEERAEGKKFMIWGIVGFAVVFSVWGILTLFNQSFKLQNLAPRVPTTDTPKIQN